MTASPPPSAPILTPTSAHPVLDARVQEVVDLILDMELPPLRCRPLEAMHRQVGGARQSSAPRAAVDIVDLDLPLTQGGSVPIRILRPQGAAGMLPAILYLHGGGWVMGDRETHDGLMRDLAVGSRAAVVFVDYPLAPAARYPAQNEVAFSALLTLASQAGALGLDARRMAVAGDCAGAAIAASVALMTKARRGPALAAQVLFCPITAPVSTNASYIAFAQGPGPSADDLRFFQESLLGARAGDPSAYVLDTPLQQLAGLPPTLVVTAEADVVRDEGEAYARKLMRAGVDVTALRVNGTVHDFIVLEALRETSGARAALLVAQAHLRSAFQPDMSP